MRNSRNPRNVCGTLDQINRILDRLNRIRERRSRPRTRNTRRILGGNTNDGKLILRVDMEGLDGSIQDAVVGLDVGGDDGEGEVLEESTELVWSTVKLMVSERHAVETHLVECLCDFLAAVVGIEECALSQEEEVRDHHVENEG